MTTPEFRQNVQDAFANGLGITFVPGKLEGPNQWHDWLGSCFLRRMQTMPSRAAEQEIFVIIRVFAPFSSQGVLSPTQPYDPTPLEEMADKVLAVCAANQTGLGAWYQLIQSLEIYPEVQGLEAVLKAYSANPGVAA